MLQEIRFEPKEFLARSYTFGEISTEMRYAIVIRYIRQLFEHPISSCLPAVYPGFNLRNVYVIAFVHRLKSERNHKRLFVCKNMDAVDELSLYYTSKEIEWCYGNPRLIRNYWMRHRASNPRLT